MDWQHLLMNGEHLPEYAALLAAEGLLGHQHANSGWGTFDDDNMVGATAFMETVELALELRRAGYGDERRAPGLRPLSRTPRTRSPPSRRSVRAVALHRRGRAAASTTRALREAQQRKDAVAAYELVYAALGRPRGMTRLVGLDVGTVVGQGRSRSTSDGGGRSRSPSARYPLSTPRPGWSEQDPEDWWRGARRRCWTSSTRRARPASGSSGQMHGLVALDADDRPLRPAILWNDGRTQAQCEEIEERVGFERLVELTGNRALAGFTAPKLLWLRDARARDLYARIAHVLLPKDYVRLRLTGEHAIDVADASGTLLFDVAARDVERRGARRARARSRRGCRAVLRVARRSPASRHGGVPVAAGAGDQAAGALGVGVVAEGGPASVVLGTSRRRLRRARPLRATTPRRACTPSATRCRGAWHVMGVMLSAAGSLQWLRESVAAGSYDELVGGGRRVGAGRRGPAASRPTWRASARRTPIPTARGAFAGLEPAPRPRRAGAGRARGRRLRAARRARPRRRARRAPGAPAACRAAARAAQLWLRDRRLGARAAARAHAPSTRAPPTARRCSAGVAGGVWPDARAAVAACVRVTRVVEPRAEWVEPYAEAPAVPRALSGAAAAVGLRRARRGRRRGPGRWSMPLVPLLVDRRGW